MTSTSPHTDNESREEEVHGRVDECLQEDRAGTNKQGNSNPKLWLGQEPSASYYGFTVGSTV